MSTEHSGSVFNNSFFMSPPLHSVIRRERRKYGLTQGELARLLGLKSRGHVSLIERGVRAPSVEHYLILQSVFLVHGKELFPRIHELTQAHVSQSCDALYRELVSTPTPRTHSVRTLLHNALVNVALESVTSPSL
jgi:transcriptional regulator with XRE-family HTH domain